MTRFSVQSAAILLGTALLLGACFRGGSGTALFAQPAPAPSQDQQTLRFLERDPVTGAYRMFGLLPNGEKKLLQTFPQLRAPLTGTDADYLHALNALPLHERYIIGVELKTIPTGLHERLGIPADCGLIVANLIEGKPADKAGLHQHDLLLKVNGTPVCQPGDVVRMVNETRGEAVTLTILRDQEPFDLKVVPVEAQPGDFAARVVPRTPMESGLPEGVLPPGVQVAGPGMIVPSPRSADIEMLHADLTALQQQVKALCQEVKELQEQLRQK